MKKLPLNTKLKAEHKSNNTVLAGTPEVKTTKKNRENEWIRKQFAQDGLIHQRIKCRVTAMVCCLLHQA